MITEPQLVREVNRIIQAVERGKGTVGGTSPTDEDRRKRRELTLREMLNQGMTRAHRGVMDLADALVPIPHSLGQLVRQSVMAASPGTVSTLQKSWNLVMMQIGRVFAPLLLRASKALQEFAETLKGAINTVKDTAKTGADARERMTIAQLKNDVKQFDRLDSVDQDMKRAEFRQKISTKEGRQKALDVYDKASPELKRVIEQITQRLNRDFHKEMTDPGRPRGGRIGSNFAHDLRPPGYHATYQGFEQARQNLQLAALNTTPADLKELQEHTKIFHELLKEVQEMNEEGGLPPQRLR